MREDEVVVVEHDEEEDERSLMFFLAGFLLFEFFGVGEGKFVFDFFGREFYSGNKD